MMKRLRQIPVHLRLALIGILTSLVALSPQPRQLRESYGEAYRALEDASPGLAVDRLATILAFEPWRAELRLVAGHYAVQGSDYSAAVEFLESAGRQLALSSDDWLILGDAYHALGQDSQAITAWQRAAESGADLLDMTQRLLPVHLAQGDAVAITQDLRTLADLQPGDAHAQYQAGLHLAALDPQAALPYLESVARLDRSLSMQVNPLRDAILTAALTEEPSYALVSVGRKLAALEEWELASRAFERAVQINPNYAEAWAFWAESLQHLEHPDLTKAKTALEKALEINPDLVLVHLLGSVYWQRQRENDRAQEHLTEALRLEPENPIIYIEIGNLLARKGEIQQAYTAFQKAVHLAPRDVSYRRVLVDFLLRHQIELRESALPVARQAVILAPNDPAALDLLGETLFLLGDYHTAERFVERALKLDAQYAPALMHLGVISYYLGEGEKARQLLAQARNLAEDPATLNQAQRLIEYYFP